MDDWNATIVILTFPNTIEENNLPFIWDNITSGQVIQPYNGKYFIFIIGMAFLSSLFVGIFLHWFYLFLLKKFAPQDGDESPDGIYNSGFMDDESHQPVNDHPPSYDTVMSGASVTSRESIGNILKRFLSRKEVVQNENLEQEENPPSYTVALASLQRELNNQ